VKRFLATIIAASGACVAAAVAESPSMSVPIEPAPTPIIPMPHAAPAAAPAPPAIVAPPPETPAVSQINPTAGPVPAPKIAARPECETPSGQPAGPGGGDRETKALNRLAAAGYGRFGDVRRIGCFYRATIDDEKGRYTVIVDPDSGRIIPDSAAADRETRALNLLARHGYVQVDAIRPAGAGFTATVRRDGRPIHVTVDIDRGRVTHD